MGYQNLKSCIHDLEKNKDLIRIDEEIDPHLELAAVQRRAYQNRGPALLFTKVKGTPFPVLANLFGTETRTHFLFRDTIDSLKYLFRLKKDPQNTFKNPVQSLKIPRVLWNTRPRWVNTGPILENKILLKNLPQIVSWKDDGGAFITLPQVYTEDCYQPGIRHSNLGMYRVQMSGNNYSENEIGLHYQLHRGIGIHHTHAVNKKVPLRVNVFIGGPPALTLAAIMPLPEGIPEVYFAGALGGNRLSVIRQQNGYPIPAQADFVISGTIVPNKLLPEGPFGDHLGYYSLKHDYPVLKIESIHHRPDAIWSVTSVGRPPQEDTNFGKFIHDLTSSLIPDVLPGVRAVHAVDAAGVHPLLFAIGSERYTPYNNDDCPKEILTQANAILGQGQLSLAKYLMIANVADNPELNINNIADFLIHILERADWKRDLHFQTRTTIDTLDYSGTGINEGSKVVIAATGQKKHSLSNLIPKDLNFPSEFNIPKNLVPGILIIQGPKFSDYENEKIVIKKLSDHLENQKMAGIRLIVVCDNSNWTAENLNNFIWITFTRSNPSHDIYGVQSFSQFKHWGCAGPLIIDARLKPHHAPPLVDDPDTEKKVDSWGLKGRPLHKII